MAELKLRNCPFCGGKAKLLRRRNGDRHDSCVRCMKCGASCGIILASRAYESEKLASEAWNTRYLTEYIVKLPEPTKE